MAHARGKCSMVGSAMVLMLAVVVPLSAGESAHAATAAVGFGKAGRFAVLAGETITNTGQTTITGDVGLHPGSAVTGFPPGKVHGQVHKADSVALQAKKALTTAYLDAAGRPSGHAVSANLGGRTLKPGVYRSGSSMGLTGTLTLDGKGDPNAVFIFQMGSTLTTASASKVNMINAAKECNTFWQVGSSATLGTNSLFRGNLMALTSIAVQTGARIYGRALARNGSVTLDDNVITRSVCAGGTGGGGGGGTSGSGGGQVSHTPSGGVAAGDGWTGDTKNTALLVFGVCLLASAGVLAVRRRFVRERSPRLR